MTMLLDAPVSNLKGIGEKTEKLFNKMGVYTIRDILLFFPRDYKNYPQISAYEDLEAGNYASVMGMIYHPVSVKYFRKISVQTAKAFLSDENMLELVWYRMPYIKNNIKLSIPYVFHGRIAEKGDHLRMEQPALFSPDDYKNLTDRPMPVYSATKGLSQKTVEKAVRNALSQFSFPEVLPDRILEKRNLLSLSDAVKNMHFPADDDILYSARNRFAYEELLQFFLESKSEEKKTGLIPNRFELKKRDILDSFISKMPFSLTESQSKSWQDIMDDFQGENISERLIQGDVGCGKTIIAFLSMLFMAENGYQSSIMAPTEVLARQHYETFNSYIEEYDLPFKAVLLVGSLKKSEKKNILSQIENGQVDFIIGTHALIQEDVNFNNVALAVTDEQHRFGVKQRRILFDKGIQPFSILLSATPIPRTLALIMYNGMKVSVINELPKDRLKIKTAVINQSSRTKAWQMAASEIKKGHQIYIVCPLVESSDNIEGENVYDYADKFQDALGSDIRSGILHGKMKAEEKEQLMSDFKDKKIDVLISTTVIEVGVNVPNATLMIIENAERFGLASLHQLRGRVGRGQFQSYCILINSASEKNERARDRLMILGQSTDGFEIARKDLEMRGPGDFRGIRQSGDMSFTIADIYQDALLLEYASYDAEEILQEDPELEKEENAYFKLLRDRERENIFTNL